MVIVLPLPERALLPQDRIHALGGERFPRVDYFCEPLTGKEPDDYVHVIRHDAPSKKPVALVVEVPQRGCYFVGDGGIPQVTSASATVEIFFDDRRREDLNLPALVRAEGAMELICGFDDGFTLRLDLIENGLRKGIRQAECDEVGCAFLFPVGEAAAIADCYFAEARAGRSRDSRRDAGATVGRRGAEGCIGAIRLHDSSS